MSVFDQNKNIEIDKSGNFDIVILLDIRWAFVVDGGVLYTLLDSGAVKLASSLMCHNLTTVGNARHE